MKIALARVIGRWLTTLIVLGLVISLLWIFREPVLASIGFLVVDEASLEPADLVVIFASAPVPAAEEAARLVKNGYVSRVLVFSLRTGDDPDDPDDTDDILDRLGIVVPKPHEVAVLVLSRMGVRAEAITVERLQGSGTNGLVRATARYAHRRGLTRLIVIAQRSHTRRIGKLLKAYLGGSSVVIARAPARDRFRPDQWWRNRNSTRELVVELLRWFNSFVLGDFWRGAGERRNLVFPMSPPINYAGLQVKGRSFATWDPCAS